MSVLRPWLLQQDGVCLARVHDLHQHVQRTDCECRIRPGVTLQLGLLDAAAAPPDLMHWQEATAGLVDVHEAVCADAIGPHQPAQLDDQPVRVGALLLRSVELFHALGGLLAAQSACAFRAPSS